MAPLKLQSRLEIQGSILISPWPTGRGPIEANVPGVVNLGQIVSSPWPTGREPIKQHLKLNLYMNY